ncbi:MAG: hypothetical protein LBR54_02825, partial [Oscillospiraceae bacterium]|nr:hypothetical protein [Oscillospiraceae bacterium]
MNNSQLLPFERNRYYSGKLLTSTDFLAEQTYFNNKRRFTNSLLFGAGIVCGFAVYNLDDMSFMVESGVAIDGLGREIVLENSVIKKMSAVEGFDSLETEDICLCLKYTEEDTQPVYSIGTAGSGGNEYEPNRIRENASLFLIDKSQLQEPAEIQAEFLNSVCLYYDDHYTVNVSMPATVSCGRYCRIQIDITKNSDTGKPFSMDCVLQMPAFTNEFGERELAVSV